MKYCIIHLVGNTHGGVASMAKTLMMEQVSDGHKVVAIVTDDNKEFADSVGENVEVKYLKKNGFLGVTCFLDSYLSNFCMK